MKALFADANYWVALLDHNDEPHGIATRISGEIGSHRVITSEFVLLEVLQLSMKFRTRMREPALKLIERMRVDPNTEVVSASGELFQKACKIFGERNDKEWDPIDCSSFVIMKEKGITEALTHDKHFMQMGFQALLREENQ